MSQNGELTLCEVRDLLVKTARRAIGVPYGRLRENCMETNGELLSTNCFVLTDWVARICGLWEQNKTLGEQRRFACGVRSFKEGRKGDLVFTTSLAGSTKKVGHVGILVDGGGGGRSIVHACVLEQQVVEESWERISRRRTILLIGQIVF